MANSDLQNSYGPEMAPNGHDFPQAVAGDGLEALPPGHQHPLIAPPYNEQQAKQDQYNPAVAAPPHDTGRKKRIAGLPVVAFWGIIVGLVLILAIGLGVGLGVGLSQRDSSGGSAATTSADPATTSAASLTPSSSTASSTASTSSTTTASTTTSAASSEATARNVEICNQASLISDCTNLTVPVNTCINFPSAYNDSVSSVDTGGPDCAFYTGRTCTGESWTTSGTNYLIPGEYNDAFSSVACFV